MTNLRGNVSKAVRLHAAFFHLLPGRKKEPHPYRRNALIFEGFFIATMMHFIYNALIKMEIFGQTWTFLIVPLLFIMAWYIWSRFFIHLYSRIIDLMETRRGSLKVKIH